MIDLIRFFRNPFNDRRINLGELVAFASTHLARMVVNNPGGVLSARIAATSAALDGLGAATSDDIARLGARKARVQGKEAFRTVLPDKVARLHGAVVAVFGVKSPELTECFPQGRTVFMTCPDAVLGTELNTLHGALVKWSAQVGQPAVDDAAALVSTWEALLTEVRVSAAGKQSQEKGLREARAALQRELFRNLLALAQHFLEEEEMARLYCPQHLLEHASQERQPEESAA